MNENRYTKNSFIRDLGKKPFMIPRNDLNKVTKVEIVKVIEITRVIGDGTPESPATPEHQYWDKNGNLLGVKIFTE